MLKVIPLAVGVLHPPAPGVPQLITPADISVSHHFTPGIPL